MEQANTIWAKIKELITSRTIWGIIVMLLGSVGIKVDGLDVALVQAGDSLVTAAGALLALVGYIDRRPKASEVAKAASLPAR